MTIETDASGNVIAYPVISWTLLAAAKIALLIKFECQPSPNEIAGPPRPAEMILTPKQALDLAEDLSKGAHKILAQRPDRPAN